MKKLFVVCLALVWPMTAVVHASVPIKASLAVQSANQVNLSWIATPGYVYGLNSTTNLLQPWQPVAGQPPTFTTTNNSLTVTLPVNSVAGFYQVVRLDTQGPQIYQTSPLNNAIAVSQQAVLQAWLQDETGVNTNSIVFAIGTNAPVTLHDPRLAWSTNGVLTYTPATNEVLGALGQIVTVSLSAADTLGNLTTNFTWSFQLALPTILSSNIVFLGSGTNPPASLILVSTNGNTFTYSYTGNSSGLSNGMQLINSDQVTGYTVTVLSFTEQPTNNTVVVVTRPTLLAELLQQGSLNCTGFTEVTNGPAKQSLTQLGLPLNYSYPLNEVLYQIGNLTLETTPGSAVNLNAELNIAANVSNFTLTGFQATLGGTASFQLDFEALAQASNSYSGTVTLIPPISRTFFGFLGPLPVWLTVKFEVDAGFDASLEAEGQITAGIGESKQFLYGERWDQTTGWTSVSQRPATEFSVQPPAWQIDGSADLTVYLLPKVTLLVNSVAGVTGDLKPYADLNYSVQLNPPKCDLSLYAGLDSDLALDLTVWDSKWGQLPSVNFDLIPQTLLWQTNCSNEPLGTPPEIILDPVNQTVQAGSTAVFQVEAQGSDPLMYQWSWEGLPLTDDGRVTGSESATLVIADAQTNDAGGYSARVSNPFGTANSSVGVLSIVPLNTNVIVNPFGSVLVEYQQTIGSMITLTNTEYSSKLSQATSPDTSTEVYSQVSYNTNGGGNISGNVLLSVNAGLSQNYASWSVDASTYLTIPILVTRALTINVAGTSGITESNSYDVEHDADIIEFSISGPSNGFSSVNGNVFGYGNVEMTNLPFSGFLDATPGMYFAEVTAQWDLFLDNFGGSQPGSQYNSTCQFTIQVLPR